MKNKQLGTIVEVEEYQITLLCKDGTFHTIEREENHFPVIGESISFEVEEVSMRKNVKLALPLITIFTILLFAVFNMQQGQVNQATYLLAIDINPSVELTFDEDWKLLSIEALNDDAEQILLDLEIENQEVDTVIPALISRLSETGYIKSGELAEVNSTLVRLKGEAIQQAVPLQTMLADAVVAHGATPKIEVYEEEEAYYQEAKKDGLSVNQYRETKQKENQVDNNKIEEEANKQVIKPANKQDHGETKEDPKKKVQPQIDNKQNNEKIGNIEKKKNDNKEKKAVDTPKNNRAKEKIEKPEIPDKPEKTQAPIKEQKKENDPVQTKKEEKDKAEKSQNNSTKENDEQSNLKESKLNQSESNQPERKPDESDRSKENDNKKSNAKEKAANASEKSLGNN